jgi:hypothetical protein
MFDLLVVQTLLRPDSVDTIDVSEKSAALHVTSRIAPRIVARCRKEKEETDAPLSVTAAQPSIPA